MILAKGKYYTAIQNAGDLIRKGEKYQVVEFTKILINSVSIIHTAIAPKRDNIYPLSEKNFIYYFGHYTLAPYKLNERIRIL